MNVNADRSRRWFSHFAWAILALNIPVILWGAYVRVSFSGDGCGAHWPFCNGSVVPEHMAKPMIIEFTHRLMTGADSIGAILLCIWAFRSFEKGHAVRRYAGTSLFFLFVEALLGAGLVLFRKVAHDQSAGRAVYLSAHLTNTMLLLGALTATAWLAHNKLARMRWRSVPRPFLIALALTVVVSIAGVIAALGDMLFPTMSVAAGFQQDLSASSHFLLRLRLFHPVLAAGSSAYIILAARKALRSGEGTTTWRAGFSVVVLVVVQLIAGVVNIGLLAPIWMQLLHLFLADLVWLAVVWMALEMSRVSPSTQKTVTMRSQFAATPLPQ